MKTASDELRELIQSLSTTEQNQFASEISASGTHAYLILFEIYTKHEYKPDGDLKKLPGLKNIERIKHYLHKQVLSFMARNSSPNSEKEIMDMLLAADALAERSLFLQAQQIMNKAKKIAEKKQLYIFKLLISERIHRIQSGLGNTQHFEYFISDFDKKEFPLYLKNIAEEQEAKAFQTRRRLFALKNNSLMRNSGSIIELKNTFGTYIKKNPASIKSFAARNEFYIIAAYYHQQLGKQDKAMAFFEQSAKEYETINPNPGDNYVGYAVTLHNLMFTYSRSYNFHKIRGVLDKLISIKPKNRYHRNFIMQSYINYESLYCKHFPQFAGRTNNLKLVEKYIRENGRSVADLQLLQALFNLSVNYFIDKNFRKALEIINMCDTIDAQGLLKDHMSVVKTYKLVVYYEMQKLDLLSFAIKNTYRFMLVNMQYYAFEKEVIKALKKIINVSGIRQQNRIWEETYFKLLALKKNPDVIQVFNLFNFTGWIYCRVHHHSYATIMNEA